MKAVCTLLFAFFALSSFASDSIPKPFKWGFKFNYEAVRSVPRYLYIEDKKKAAEFNFTFLNIGWGFQIYEKKQRNYHEISLSRIWYSNNREGYRSVRINALDSSRMYRNNENFQIGLRYSYYLQTSSRKKEKRHKFFLEFPFEIFYHKNTAGWYHDFDTLNNYKPSEAYESDVVGFSFGITPHYHYFITNQVYLDVAIPVAYTGMYCFTRTYSDDGTPLGFVMNKSSGYFNEFGNVIPFSLRLSLGVKLYTPQKKKPLMTTQ